MSSSKRRIGTQYGLAVVSVAVVALLRWLLQPALADAAPLILFVLPIVICGWYGGIGPALLATTLGTLIGAYLFLPAGRAQHSLRLGDLPLVVSFFLVGVVLSISHDIAYRMRSEEHTSELQSHSDLVCRLLLEKKKNNQI